MNSNLTISEGIALAKIALIWTVNDATSTAFHWVAQAYVVITRAVRRVVSLSVKLAA